MLLMLHCPVLLLFPAYAGVIPYDDDHVPGMIAFPRIRGGDPFHPPRKCGKCRLFPAYAGGDPNMAQFEPAFIIFSPHMRG